MSIYCIYLFNVTKRQVLKANCNIVIDLPEKNGKPHKILQTQKNDAVTHSNQTAAFISYTESAQWDGC